MYWLKACARCHGDLHEIADVGDTYVSCIQCGKILTAEQEATLPRPRATRPAIRAIRPRTRFAPAAA